MPLGLWQRAQQAAQGAAQSPTYGTTHQLQQRGKSSPYLGTTVRSEKALPTTVSNHHVTNKMLSSFRPYNRLYGESGTVREAGGWGRLWNAPIHL